MAERILLINKVSQVCGELLGAEGFEVETGGNPGEEELVKLAPKFSCIALRGASNITAPVLEAGSKGSLRLVVRVGAGVNNIDLAAATRNGVIVCNTPGTNARGVIELTIAALLAMARTFVEANNSLKAGKWEKNKFVGTELLDKTLGVIGLGNIGRGVAQIGRALGMRVLGCDPVFTEEKAKELGIELVDLDNIYSESDYITLHASLTEESKNMIGAAAFAKMKAGAALANCARAQLVDSKALMEALASGKLRYYYTDVFLKEPPDPGDPLVAHPRVLVTPHLGGSTEEAEILGARQAAMEIAAFFKEGKVVNSVNFFPGDPALAPWEPIAEKMGDFAYQYLASAHKVSEVAFRYNGALSQYATERLTAAFFNLGREGLALPVAQDENGDLLSGLGPGDGVLEVGGSFDGFAVQFKEDVADLEAGLVGGSALKDLADEGPLPAAEFHGVGHFGGEFLDGDAEPAADDFALFADAAHDLAGQVDGNGEPDAHVSAGPAGDGGVDADDLAAHVDERSAGVAGVDGGVGLEEGFVIGDADARAAGGADDAARDGLFEAEGRTDGEDPVSDFERVGVAEFGGGEEVGLDSDDGDFGGRVGADDLGFELAPVGQADGDLIGSGDDVIVGQDVAVGIDDDARAEPLAAKLSLGDG